MQKFAAPFVGAPFCGAPVRPLMLNMPKSAAVCQYQQSEVLDDRAVTYQRLERLRDEQWRRHGVDWGGHVHPTFARGHS